jgi:hypothetical protein
MLQLREGRANELDQLPPSFLLAVPMAAAAQPSFRLPRRLLPSQISSLSLA